MHSFHPDVHEVGLQNDCQACLDHAEKLFTLDHEMLSSLVVLAIKMRKGEAVAPRTVTEGIARANVMNHLEVVGKFMEVLQLTGNLDYLIEYYQRFWRIKWLDCYPPEI